MAIESKEIDAKIFGAGSMSISGPTGQESKNFNGAGDLNAEGFKAIKAKIIINGAGSANINVEQELDIQISGAGVVNYKGKPQVNQHISGAGKITQI